MARNDASMNALHRRKSPICKKYGVEIDRTCDVFCDDGKTCKKSEMEREE
ncbi:MAG: hypothetical protein WCD81_00700 [Candidatus Bathyarchaeia archaeon]